MNLFHFSVLALFSMLASMPISGTPPTEEDGTPILVELFTSEGCSSCPPADAYLRTLDRQPVPGARMIVLSEHVDYWNHIGWKDPYSSHLFSERQAAYAKRFDVDSYTPQMVVDGSQQFVGSNSASATAAFAGALRAPKILLRLSAISLQSGTLRARLEGGAVPSSSRKNADLYVALALNQAQSQVSGGENAGHSLTHVAVVHSLRKIASVRRADTLAQNIEIKLDSGLDPRNLRLVAFLQESGQGRVIGATEQIVAVTP